MGELGVITDRWLDTSNFERVHPLNLNVSFRSLGKFKFETADVPEFCGLCSKMYSLAMLTVDGVLQGQGLA